MNPLESPGLRQRALGRLAGIDQGLTPGWPGGDVEPHQVEPAGRVEPLQLHHQARPEGDGSFRYKG